MLPSTLPITPVGAVPAAGPVVAIGDGRQAAFQRALQGLVGQSVTGEVLSRFSDGSFMVNVAEHAVRMQLPADAGVGSRLPLTVLSAEPRATFELNQPSSSVVLYGEAHTPAGTGDLYSPPAGTAASSAAATGAAGGAGNGAAASVAGNAGSAGSIGVTSSSSSAAGALAGAATERAAAGQPATANSAAAAAASLAGAASMATQLAAAAGYPALAGLNSPRSNPAGNVLPSASDDESAGTDAPRPAAAGANAGSASHAAYAGNSASQTGRAHSAAASLLGKAPLTPLAELPALDGGTSQPELSNAARILGSVLSQPAAASALPLLGKTALFSQGAPEPAQLARTLQNTVEDSGLFYESHVAAWSRGERTLEQLQREPQMQAARTPSDARAETAVLPDRSAAQQINQQLLTHEQGRIQWQGEAWPGQPMQWEIQRQSERQSGGQSNAGQDPTPVWRSSLKLRFAALGELAATITMVGQQVHLQLQTSDAASGATLRAQAELLQQSLAAAGIPLSSCHIQDGPAHDG